MTIKEVEEATGITKQNIRFYEKKGLVNPDRNEENDYRNYSQKDVENILMIKMLRKLDMPIEEVKKVLEKDISISEAVKQHQEKLREEENRLQAAIHMCQEIQKANTNQVDVKIYLNRMEELEQNGGKFKNILNDYKKVCEAESAKMFSFVPDSMCRNPREFSIALCEYADENHLNLTITNESMYPEFEIDGILYVADRIFGRFGAVVRCRVADEMDVEPLEIPENRRKKIKVLRRVIGAVLLAGCLILLSEGDPWHFLAMLVLSMVMFTAILYSYKNVRQGTVFHADCNKGLENSGFAYFYI